ncbi:TPA: GlsB/YeaQ/YmgE family stress response membrane protein, partial [Enterococcus faecium]|nr:GlsB/YeaQ/YmgE family stress response membrane protein [Enterococcus faecium]
ITNKGSSMGIIANVVAGLVGSALGQALLGSWGPSIAGMAIVPSLIGAIILVLIVSFFARKL